MNKTQLYTLSGALLASTALSSAAGAATVGRFPGDVATQTLTTGAIEVANTIFSTTASTANEVTLGTGATEVHFGARFDNNYLGTVETATGTVFSVEFIPTGARFVQGSLSINSAKFIAITSTGTFNTTVSAASACANLTNLATRFVVQNCTGGIITAAGRYGYSGIFLTGVTFNAASGLAEEGASVSLAVAVLDPNSTTPFEASSSANIITSVAPIEVDITAAADAEANPNITPTAFSRLTVAGTDVLSLTLATISISHTGALSENLTSPLLPASAINTVTITVESGILSNGAVTELKLTGANAASSSTIATVANFDGGSFTFGGFSLAAATGNSFVITAAFDGETAIDVADAGEVTVVFGPDTYDGDVGQSVPDATGETTAINQGGFNSQVNSFNSSANGANGYGSILRIHNNGTVAGGATITIYASDSGEVLGSYTTDTIEPNGTLQLFAADIEGSDGADIAEEDRTGVYTIVVTGPIIGYLQHLLYDGVNGLVADVSAFRNGGDANSAP